MTSQDVLRIANCSGFYGDRVSAAREMVQGGPIDVLTGDWLAELTMLLLGKAMLSGRPGYARTFLTQLEQVLPTCLERGIKIVANAGGLDPAGCAAAVTELARRAGLTPVVAHVDGDDLLARVPELIRSGHRLANADTGETLAEAGVTPLTAHAYLGGLPIARALSAGADIVVTGRVTDAALAVGPGMWRFGWTGDDLDALAGAVVAGHVIECGCQATGGNYAFFAEVPDLATAGFPLAELAADGSAVITKHPGTGGQVSVGTVTAQLLYEIGGPRYLNPDVTARFDTIALEQVGPDRVRMTGVRGEPPPADLKVSLNYAGGYRNSMILAIEGLDVAAKADLAERAIWARIDGGKDAFETADVDLVGSDPALLRIAVLDQDKAKVGRAFSAAVVETGLASYPGFYALTPPGDASMYGVFWPSSVPAELVTTRVIVDGEPVWTGPARTEPSGSPPPPPPEPAPPEPAPPEPALPSPPSRAHPSRARPSRARPSRARDSRTAAAKRVHRAGAARPSRGGQVGRQGRERQCGRLGPHRGRVRLAGQLPHHRSPRGADPGRRRPADRAAPAAQPAGAQFRDRRPARPRRRRQYQARPAGQGARRGTARRARGHSRRAPAGQLALTGGPELRPPPGPGPGARGLRGGRASGA